MEEIKFAFAVLYRPLDTFNYIKDNREKLNYWIGLLLIFMCLPVRIATIFIEHYPIAALDPVDTNILLETVKILAPILTWVIVNFSITSIMGGETTIGEVFMATAYSVVPYLVFSIPLGIFSNILSRSEIGLYNSLHSIKWLWVILLIIIYVKEMNDYSIIKTLFICVLGIIGMFLTWGLLLLIYVLTNQLYAFAFSVIMEIRMSYGR